MLDWALWIRRNTLAIRVLAQYVSDGKAVTKDFSQLNRYEVTQQGQRCGNSGTGLVLFAGRCCCGKDSGKDRHHADSHQSVYHRTGHELLEQLKSSHKAVITLEDGVWTAASVKRLHGSTATPQ